MTARFLAGLRPSVPFSLYAQQVGKRKGQELLAGAGIAVGVALVFGVLVASTSVTRSASESVRGVSGGATMQLAARSPAGFDARLVPAVEQLAGVQRSGAVLRENTTIVGPTGRTPAQLVGFTVGVIGLGGSSTRALAQGAVPEAGGLVLSSSLARTIGVRTGQSVTVLAAGAAHKIRVVELLSGSRFGALAASPVAVAQMSVAQTLTGRAGRVTQILVKPRPGANTTVSRALERLAGGRLEVLPANNEIALLDEAFRPSNLSGETVALCEDAGLLYWQRVISLLATVRDSELVMRPSFWQTLHARRRRAKGDRTQVVAHEDVLVFRKPQTAATKARAVSTRKAA